MQNVKEGVNRLVIFLLLGVFAISVQSCTIPPGQLTYIGSEACERCHGDIYETFIGTGHPYKFQVVDGSPPMYPDFLENFMALPYDDIVWGDIAGVIGGFGWKARFVDRTGNVVGTKNSIVHPGEGLNQLNFFETLPGRPIWSDYNKTSAKPYDYECFRCHTTGAVRPEDTDTTWLEDFLGIETEAALGTFAFGGIQCEECHGKGSGHALFPQANPMTTYTGAQINELCGRCHYRDEDHHVLASGDFVQHHEQYDEVIHTKHFDTGMNCTQCHNPHQSTLWGGEGANEDSCNACHPNTTIAAPHGSLQCVDCHMPYIAKSALQVGYLKGDVRSHSFAINASADYQMLIDTPDGKRIMQEDENGHTKISLKYVCYQCHKTEDGEGGSFSTRTIQELADYAVTMHN